MCSVACVCVYINGAVVCSVVYHSTAKHWMWYVHPLYIVYVNELHSRDILRCSC